MARTLKKAGTTQQPGTKRRARAGERTAAGDPLALVPGVSDSTLDLLMAQIDAALDDIEHLQGRVTRRAA